MPIREYGEKHVDCMTHPKGGVELVYNGIEVAKISESFRETELWKRLGKSDAHNFTLAKDGKVYVYTRKLEERLSERYIVVATPWICLRSIMKDWEKENGTDGWELIYME